MDSTLDQIKAALIDLSCEMKQPANDALVAALGRLDALVATHRGELDPRLAHFLARRSYAKALAFLDGGSAVPRGSCG